MARMSEKLAWKEAIAETAGLLTAVRSAMAPEIVSTQRELAVSAIEKWEEERRV